MPLAVFDVETTGVDTQHDAIFSFGCVRMEPSGEVTKYSVLIKPWKPIPPEVEELTGTKNEDLEKCLPFADNAEFIHNALKGAVLVGFNASKFDQSIIWEELFRCGITWEVETQPIIDVFNLYRRFHPRDLNACAIEYTGKSHVNAHGALPDAEVTFDIFQNMLLRHDEIGALSMEDVAKYSMEDTRSGLTRIDLKGTIMRRPDGVAVYGTFKNKGVPISEDQGYARWILNQDFPEQTKLMIEKELEAIRKNPPKKDGDLF